MASIEEVAANMDSQNHKIHDIVEAYVRLDALITELKALADQESRG